MRRTAPAVGLAVVLAAGLAGCSGADVAGPCGQAWDAAAEAGATQQSPEALLPTYSECGSFEEWRLSAEKHPDVLGGTEPEVFARDACDFTEALATAPVCSTLPI